jgi:hypothetical protein
MNQSAAVRRAHRRLFRVAAVLAGASGLVLAAGCNQASLRVRPPRDSVPPCRVDPLACERGTAEPAGRDTTRRPDRRP